MKGIIQGFALMILMMGLSLGFMTYVGMDHLRANSIAILKQSMTETMLSLADASVEERQNTYFSLLTEALTLRKPSHEHYKLEVLGFNAMPLALRVRLSVFPDYSPSGHGYPFEETMIEVQS